MKPYKTYLKEAALSFLDCKLSDCINIGKYGYKALKSVFYLVVGVITSPIALPISALIAKRKESK